MTKSIQLDLSKLRSGLFWDTTLENINWIEHKPYVLKRVMERGTEEEKKIIQDFYSSKDLI